MEKIIYKVVYDSNGTINGLELWQAGGHITLSLESQGLHKNGYRWIEVKETVDILQESQKQQVIDSAGYRKEFEAIQKVIKEKS